VPQSPILGQTLFLFYINHLSINIQWADTVTLAQDTDILIKTVNDNILAHKVIRIMKK
jgi:hypothetical protein